MLDYVGVFGWCFYDGVVVFGNDVDVWICVFVVEC